MCICLCVCFGLVLKEAGAARSETRAPRGEGERGGWGKAGGRAVVAVVV